MIRVKTRNQALEDFNFGKVEKAAMAAIKEAQPDIPAEEFINELQKHFESLGDDTVLTVEQVLDTVEEKLATGGFLPSARAFIKYRSQKAEMRLIRERVEYMKHYSTSAQNAATSSETDANANVAIKNVANLDGEVYKTLNRRVQRYWVSKKLEEIYPEVAKQYEKDLESHIIYTHDESSAATIKNYCEAGSLYTFIQKGTTIMDGTRAKAPTNLDSFCGQFVNYVFLLSAQCKGAVAFGELFNAIDYICAKQFGEDYTDRLDEIASIYPKKTIRQAIRQAFQHIVYGINQPAGNRSYQSPFTNISYYDSNYWHALFDGMVWPDGSKPVWERVSYLQKDFMRWFNEERTKCLLTFPVETMALLTDGKDVMDKEYKEFNAEMYAAGHSFFTYISDNPNALASCCRLRNEIKENTFSFTTGLTGVQTGSANVITLNHNRIVQNYVRSIGGDRTKFDKEGYKAYLTSILERVYKYHIAYKTLLYEMEEAGMLNASTAGFISMRKLYCTIGHNGFNEAAEFLGMKCSYNEDYKNFCRWITDIVSEQNRLHSSDLFTFNQEFVPAEGLGSKNYNWDKEDGYWVPEDRVLYNSYFYLAHDPQTSVLDKFRMHGREFTEKLDGGVGLHCNLEEHLSKEQYLKLLDFAIANGTSYYTFNVPFSECMNEECHHIVRKPMEVCPVCGGKMRMWTRVIGFLRPIMCFDIYRQMEASKRVFSKKESVKL